MICDRCYKPLDAGDHGLGLCPLEARRRSTVIWTDDIPGGIEIANGICNEDGTPKRYYSHSAIAQACKVKGVIPYHDVYAEQGNQTLADARHREDYIKSSEYARARKDRLEGIHEKSQKRAREAAERR